MKFLSLQTDELSWDATQDVIGVARTVNVYEPAIDAILYTPTRRNRGKSAWFTEPTQRTSIQ